jgi:hypothetical protein
VLEIEVRTEADQRETEGAAGRVNIARTVVRGARRLDPRTQ